MAIPDSVRQRINAEELHQLKASRGQAVGAARTGIDSRIRRLEEQTKND